MWDICAAMVRIIFLIVDSFLVGYLHWWADILFTTLIIQ